MVKPTDEKALTNEQKQANEILKDAGDRITELFDFIDQGAYDSRETIKPVPKPKGLDLGLGSSSCSNLSRSDSQRAIEGIRNQAKNRITEIIEMSPEDVQNDLTLKLLEWDKSQGQKYLDGDPEITKSQRGHRQALNSRKQDINTDFLVDLEKGEIEKTSSDIEKPKTRNWGFSLDFQFPDQDKELQTILERAVNNEKEENKTGPMKTEGQNIDRGLDLEPDME